MILELTNKESRVLESLLASELSDSAIIVEMFEIYGVEIRVIDNPVIPQKAAEVPVFEDGSEAVWVPR